MRGLRDGRDAHYRGRVGPVNVEIHITGGRNKKGKVSGGIRDFSNTGKRFCVLLTKTDTAGIGFGGVAVSTTCPVTMLQLEPQRYLKWHRGCIGQDW